MSQIYVYAGQLHCQGVLLMLNWLKIFFIFLFVLTRFISIFLKSKSLNVQYVALQNLIKMQ